MGGPCFFVLVSVIDKFIVKAVRVSFHVVAHLSLNVTPLLNVGSFRGIDVVRNKIKMFAQQKVTLTKGRHKIIILDEADRYYLLLRFYLL